MAETLEGCIVVLLTGAEHYHIAHKRVYNDFGKCIYTYINSDCRLVQESDSDKKDDMLSHSDMTRIWTWTSQKPTLQQTKYLLTNQLSF